MHRLLVLVCCGLVLPASSALPQDLPRIGYLGADIAVRDGRAVVTRVAPSTAAAAAGLRADDVVVRVNGEPLNTPADVDRLIVRQRAGAKLQIHLERGAVLAVALPPMPREQLHGVTIAYDVVTSRAGDRLRTIVTRPARAPGKPAVVFVVGWLSCDSVEYPFGETDGFGAFLLRTAGRSGYATVRTDKPGVGDSEGPPCGKMDFDRELAGYQASFQALARYDDLDLSRVVVVGLSNGGGFAPLVATSQRVAGYVALSSWGRTWFEHMIDLERGRLARGRKSPAEIDAAMHVFAPFYDRFLIGGMTPGQILRQQPDWRPFWYDSEDGMYGRPAAFYQQLQALNLGDVWAKTTAPVLVVHGSADTIMSRADAEAIATSVGTARATFVETAEMDHLLTRNGTFAADMWRQVMDWISTQFGRK